MRLAVRRWLPEVEVTIIGDQPYRVDELGGACARRDVCLWPRCGWMRPCTGQLLLASLALTGVHA
jgi:hypothetical protein